MNILYTTDIVENKNSNGRAKFWQGRVFELNDKIFTQALFWQNLADGGTSKVMESDPVEITRAKSQTSLKDQGIFDITSAYNKQLDKISSDEKPLPMLAHKFVDNEAKVVYPCYIQPKFDGFRMICNGDQAWTRKGKVWGVDKGMDIRCIEHLFFDTQGYILDGEVMLMRPYIRQETASAAKSYDDPVKSQSLVYFVYDVIVPGLTYKERMRLLSDIILVNAPKNVIQSKTHEVSSKAEAEQLFDEYLKLGEEGIMFRSVHGEYEVNKRSRHLLKLKQFIECEFLVVDVVAQPKRPEEGMLVVDLGNDTTSTIMIEGGREKCVEILKNRDTVIGQIWTVRFQEGLTKDGNLQFAKGVCERDVDLDGEPDMFTTFNWRKQNGEKVKAKKDGTIIRSDDDESEDETLVLTPDAPKTTKSFLKANPNEDIIMVELAESDKDLKFKYNNNIYTAATNMPKGTTVTVGEIVQATIQGWKSNGDPEYPFIKYPFNNEVKKTKTSAPKLKVFTPGSGADKARATKNLFDF